eukprot:4606811-Amphidinium_carterae.1
MPQAPLASTSETSSDVPAAQVQAASASALPDTSVPSRPSENVEIDHAVSAHHAGQDSDNQRAFRDSWQTSWRSSQSQNWWSQHTFQASTEWWQREERQSESQNHSWWESSQRSQAASAANRQSHYEHRRDYSSRHYAASAARSHSRGRRSGSRRANAASAARSQSRSRQQRRAVSREPPNVDRMMPVELPRPERDATREDRVTAGTQEPPERKWQ